MSGRGGFSCGGFARGGFALVAALWLMVAISGITLSLGMDARVRRTGVANRVEHARAAALAEAGLEHSQAVLARRAETGAASVRDVLDPWAEPDALLPRETPLAEDGRYRLEARDLGSLLNVNVASERELRRFLTALAMDDGRADRLAQAMMDWRDHDDVRRARGAEVEEYLARGAPVLPANRPFARVDELRFVLGVSQDLYEKLAPLVTVRGTGRVNLSAAPVPVLFALPGMAPPVIREVLERRRTGAIGSVAQLGDGLEGPDRDAFQRSLPELLSRTTVDTRELEVVSEGRDVASPVGVRLTAVAVRSGDAVFLHRDGAS